VEVLRSVREQGEGLDEHTQGELGDVQLASFRTGLLLLLYLSHPIEVLMDHRGESVLMSERKRKRVDSSDGEH